MSVHELFSICFESITKNIKALIRKPTVFTAPECIDSLTIWITEHNKGHISRIDRVLEAMREDPSMYNFMTSFRAFAADNSEEKTETFFWLLENEAKAPELWRCNLGWMIFFSIVYENMKDLPCIQKWYDQHTEGWIHAFRPIIVSKKFD